MPKPSADVDADAARRTAKSAGLRYVSDTLPGITRRRRGKGFSYRAPDGTPIRDRDELARIRSLAIPPAYQDVWVCRDPRGHLQATGRDARGRKQYRYHPQWATVRGDGKFDRVVAFGEALPKLRRRLRTDLALKGHPRDKVLAIVVAIMAETLVRVGNGDYARSNKSYGLTTLRDRHARFASGGRVRLAFRGKGGQDHDIAIDDKRLARLVRGCQQLPGQTLFQYRDDDGTLQPVDSGMVNDYLRGVMGEDFTAKDFRTWGGTLHAIRCFGRTPLPDGKPGEEPSARAFAAVENEVVRQVASELGNTASVCRKAYIDPVVFEGWRDGSLARCARDARGQRQWEQAALRFLKRARRAGSTARKRARR
ncbi:DNA topoisomerase IB [Luteimonas vadosa]|uniref:DNA topoisomerase IB n=1 Tax=Luteimonas vadosa TaxID=1165507 RepID=A0ABP9DUK0_9GAMM